MPLYDYQCSKCGNVTEVRHGFNDSYAEACAACGGELQRVFNPAPIVFKGSGFYVTDSRAKKPSGESSGSSGESSGSSGGSSKESAA